MARWANPSLAACRGPRARARALEEARGADRGGLGWTGETLFTSGASESLAIALGRAHGRPACWSARSSMMRCCALRSGATAIAVRRRRPGRSGRPRAAARRRRAARWSRCNGRIARRACASRSPSWPRSCTPPGGLLLVDCGADACGRRSRRCRACRFRRALRAQAGRPAGHRRAAGPRPRDACARPAGRSAAIAPGPRICPALLGYRRRAGGAASRIAHAALRATARRCDPPLGRRGGRRRTARATRRSAPTGMPGVASAAQLIRFDLAGLRGVGGQRLLRRAA